MLKQLTGALSQKEKSLEELYRLIIFWLFSFIEQAKTLSSSRLFIALVQLSLACLYMQPAFVIILSGLAEMTLYTSSRKSPRYPFCHTT